MIAGGHPNVMLLQYLMSENDCVLLGGDPWTVQQPGRLHFFASRRHSGLSGYTGTGNDLIVSVTITHL